MAYQIAVWTYVAGAGAVLTYNLLEMHSRMRHFGAHAVSGVEVSTRLLFAALWPLVLAVWILLAVIVSRFGTKKGEG